MEIYFYIAFIATFVIDFSGFRLPKILNRKPFNCALCLTWWVGLLYFGLNCIFSSHPLLLEEIIRTFFYVSIASASTLVFPVILAFLIDFCSIGTEVFTLYLRNKLYKNDSGNQQRNDARAGKTP